MTKDSTNNDSISDRHLNQENYLVKPDYLSNDFDDCEALDLNNEEKNVFTNLYCLSLKSGWEYIAYVYKEGSIIYKADKYPNKVGVDQKLIKDGIKLFHSHTSDSPISFADLRQLYRKEVNEIGVICKNKDIYTIKVKNGYLPEMSDLVEFTKSIKIEVYDTIREFGMFDKLTESEIVYLFYKERLFRIVREYGWLYKGGKLDE